MRGRGRPAPGSSSASAGARNPGRCDKGDRVRYGFQVHSPQRGELEDGFRKRPTDVEAAAGSGSHEGSAATPAPRPYRRRLANLSNVRACLADVVRGIESGELADGRARVLTYALATLAGVMESEQAAGELDERLRVLEAAVRTRSRPAVLALPPGDVEVPR